MTFQWHFPPSLSSPTCFFSVPNPFCPCPARCFVSSESWPVPLLSAGSASPTPPAEVQRQTAAVARLPPPTPRIPAGSAAAPSAAGPTPPGGAVGSPAPSRPSPVPSLWHRRPGRCWESSGPLPPSDLSRPRRRERLGTSQALASQSPLGIPGKMGFQPEQQGAPIWHITMKSPHPHHYLPLSSWGSSNFWAKWYCILSCSTSLSRSLSRSMSACCACGSAACEELRPGEFGVVLSRNSELDQARPKMAIKFTISKKNHQMSVSTESPCCSCYRSPIFTRTVPKWTNLRSSTKYHQISPAEISYPFNPSLNIHR